MVHIDRSDCDIHTPSTLVKLTAIVLMLQPASTQRPGGVNGLQLAIAQDHRLLGNIGREDDNGVEFPLSSSSFPLVISLEENGVRMIKCKVYARATIDHCNVWTFL